MNHLNSFEQYKLGCVDVQQYCAFQYFLKLKDKIVYKVSHEKQIDFVGMRELCDEFEANNDFCKKNSVHISDEMLKAFMDAMDLDGNGILDGEEVIGIIYRRKLIGGQILKKD